MPAVDRSGGTGQRLSRVGVPRWVWLDVAAFLWGVLLVVLAFTDHDRGSAADPDAIFHHYTLVHDAGPAVLLFVGAPAVISLVLLGLLHRKSTRHSHLADRWAWTLTALSCAVCFVGLLVQGIVMLPAAALTVGAVTMAPLAGAPQ
jgi:quinol-cytochrome oxidoreductase complex cytochrome b subunit